MAKDENFHGYRWSDGSVRQHPEPKALNPAPNTKDSFGVPVTVISTTLRCPTPEQYAYAYAEWVKEFNEWRAKYGTR